MKSEHTNSSTPIQLARSVVITATSLIAFTTPVFADTTADSLDFIIVSDDIRKEVTEVARPSGDTSPPPASPNAGDGSGPDSGQSNNGHGNNADGVDSSNPGQGGGGPNGSVDPSGDVDDEAGGGGASPSQNSANGNNKGKKK